MSVCEFIEGTFLMPGWGCHVCRTYNGLQRGSCRNCDHERCPIQIPDHVKRCKSCGFGWTGKLPDETGDGRKLNGHCPVCNERVEEPDLRN